MGCFSSTSDWKLAPFASMRCDFGCFQREKSGPEISRDAREAFFIRSDWKSAPLRLGLSAMN